MLITKKNIQFGLKNLAIDVGLCQGHTTYTPFIILGRGRIGSNLLLTSLQAHPQVSAFGEIFRNYRPVGWNIVSYLRSGARFLIALKPTLFLDKVLFRPQVPEDACAVGFKLFYYQAQERQLKPVWTYLRNQENLRIIHLKRRNILRIHLSAKRGFRSKQWVNLNGVVEDNRSVSLNYNRCQQIFIHARTREQEYDAFFENNHKIEVWYEDIIANYEQEMIRIQKFLNVKYETVRPLTKKQNHLPLSQAISNYIELKEKFQDTPWATFFEE